MQKFYDTTGILYAVRFWRLVIYVNNGAESLRHGGIVTSIGDADFVFWRFSFVGTRRTPRAADFAHWHCAKCLTPNDLQRVNCSACGAQNR